MIGRAWETKIKDGFFKKKAIIVLGPRQVGKTTLLKKLTLNLEQVLWLNADTIEVRQLLEQPSSTRFRAIIGKNRIVVIDEAQNIADIGLKMKIMVDEMPEVQLLATGSSPLDLANKIHEPLTGRKYEFQLYPLSFQEMVAYHGLLNEIQALGHRMVFGYYPDVVMNQGDEKEILKLLADSYLYKDILIWNKIKKADRIVNLLRALAFQIGNQVSYNELGRLVGLDSETVEKYIVLLEKAFVIYRLGSFSKNLRTELRKSRKVYFMDNGVRNAIIGNYNHLELRNDKGGLWENFVVSERKKYLSYNQIYAKTYFWRTQAQQEIDYLEEYDGKLYAYEFKWDGSRKAKIPKTFVKAYPNVEIKIISPHNVEEFLTHGS